MNESGLWKCVPGTISDPATVSIPGFINRWGTLSQHGPDPNSDTGPAYNLVGMDVIPDGSICQPDQLLQPARPLWSHLWPRPPACPGVQCGIAAGLAALTLGKQGGPGHILQY